MREEERVVVRIVIEILGAPKEHVEKTLKLVMDKVKEQKYIQLLKEKVFETKKVKQFWSTFAEVEMAVEGINNLMNFCFDFMPSSVEILEPEKFSVNANYLNDLLNDLLARLHKYDMLLKNLHAENTLLKKELEKKK